MPPVGDVGPAGYPCKLDTKASITLGLQPLCNLLIQKYKQTPVLTSSFWPKQTKEIWEEQRLARTGKSGWRSVWIAARDWFATGQDWFVTSWQPIGIQLQMSQRSIANWSPVGCSSAAVIEQSVINWWWLGYFSSNQWSKTGPSKAVVCALLSVEIKDVHIKDPLLRIGKSSLCAQQRVSSKEICLNDHMVDVQ